MSTCVGVHLGGVQPKQQADVCRAAAGTGGALLPLS